MTEIDWEAVEQNLDMLDEYVMARIAIRLIHILEARALEARKK